MTIYLSQAAQLLNDNLILIFSLQQDQAPTKVPPKYADYADIFSFNLAIKLPKNTNINKHAIKPKDDKQPPISLSIA